MARIASARRLLLALLAGALLLGGIVVAPATAPQASPAHHAPVIAGSGDPLPPGN